MRIKERITRIRARNSFSFTDSGTGRRNIVRVAMLLAVIALLTWYGRYGSVSVLGGARVEISGGADGYAVRGFMKNSESPVSELIIRRGAVVSDTADGYPTDSIEIDDKYPTPAVGFNERRTRAANELSDFRDVFPFSDSVRATLMTFAGAQILAADSAIFIPNANSINPQLRETLELMIIPSSAEEEILRVRGLFRPRLMAVIPPCQPMPISNVICADTDKHGNFQYDFIMKDSRLQWRKN